MTNGSNQVIKKIRDIVEKGGCIDSETRDILLFSAVVDIYDQLESIRTETRPSLTFYRVGLFFASAIGLAVLGFIGALLTGSVEIIFK